MKKILLMVNVCCLLLSSGINVQAATFMPDFFENEKIPLNEEQLNSIEAIQINSDGTVETLEVASAELIKREKQVEVNTCSATLLAKDLYTNNSTAQEYVLTVAVSTSEAKDSSGSTTKDSVTANGCIGWIDNFGLNNNITHASGWWSGSVTDMKYYVYAGSLCIENTSCGPSFFKNYSQTALSFKLQTYAKTSKGNQISLTVNTSIFN